MQRNQSDLLRQPRGGKLHVTERLRLLFDGGTYREHTRPAERDGVYVCEGRVCGKRVVVAAQDYTEKAGTLGLRHGRNIAGAIDLALRRRCPFIAVNDSGGARIQEGVDSLAGYGGIFMRHVRASGVIPQIAVIVGPCAGGAAYSPGMSDLILAVDGVSQLFITGPKVVQAVTGERLSVEALGGTSLHAGVSGVVHARYADEMQCFDALRRLVALLPANNRAHRLRINARVGAPSFHFRLPQSTRRGYDVRDLINSVFDLDSFFEIQAEFACSAVVGLARLGGCTVGVIGNQPRTMAGVLDCDSSDKTARFVRFCDAFGMPIITFTDAPGFLPGVEQERMGIIRHGAKLLYAFAEASVPKINVIVRKAYGGAYIAMNSLHIGADRVFAWPDAQVAVMGEQGAVEILYAKEAKRLAPQARQEFLQARAQEYRAKTMNPHLALEHGYIHELIRPEETRQKLIACLRGLRWKRAMRMPGKRHGNIPL